MAILKYPENLDGSGPDFVKFTFFNYDPALKGGPSNRSAAYNASTTSVARSKIATDAGVDSIVISMPNDIASTISGDWGPKGMTGLARAALGSVASGVQTALGTEKKSAFSLPGLTSFTRDALSGVAGGFAEDALKAMVDGMQSVQGLGSNLSASDVLGLVSTSIVNPNTELLYQGTRLRKHAYRFKMIATSSSEADAILKIAQLFKKIAAPKGKDQELLGLNNRNFIGIPDVCDVTFHRGGEGKGEIHTDLPSYKRSAITQVGVDYVTEGQYMTFADGKPIGINLTLELMELKLLFSEEIGTGTNQYR